MSYFAQLRIVDESGNAVFVTKSGEQWVKIGILDEILNELKKLNLHLSTATDMELKDEDVGG